ncbi:uncharacterized protein LOC111023212 [Momordica charantia]|uniref:Uncharacterized protein LOC111023212 n=1 Tax=Momordica charantia TaxID=3673 RepID=A0A6J1DUH3_MOMCH|nr:uncharacterized protein LOC111023212 [Momordica charantia]
MQLPLTRWLALRISIMNQEHFRVDLSKRVVNKFIEQQMQISFKQYRSDLHQYYCEFEDPVEARANPPERLTNPEDWNHLCDRWETPEWKEITKKNKKNRAKLPFNHRAGSKSFLQLQHELKIKEGSDIGPVDLFGESHYNEKDGLVNDNAEDAYENMQNLIKAPTQEGCEPVTQPEACRKVLGDRPDHVKGLGYGPQPTLCKRGSSSNVTSSTLYEKELEKKVEDMEVEMREMKTENQRLKESVSTWEDRWNEISRFMAGRQGDGPSNN